MDIKDFCRTYHGALDVTMRVDDETKTLISSDTVEGYLLSQYPSFFSVDVDALGAWNSFNILYAYGLYRELMAWEADYNPLDNVDEITNEETTDSTYNVKSGSIDRTQRGQESISQTGRDTTHFGESIIDTKEYGVAFDTAVEKETGKTNTTSQEREDYVQYGRTDTHEFNGRGEVEEYNNIRDQRGGEIAFERRRHGNIGITSSMQLVTQELELRSGYNPRVMYLDDFIKFYWLDGGECV